LIETRRDLIDKKPDLVQRFVNASIIGWYNYLYGDNAAANARIKRDNPEMSDELIAYSIAKMKEYGIVDSGDSLKLGIGAMTDARMKSFFDKMCRGRRGQSRSQLQEGLQPSVQSTRASAWICGRRIERRERAEWAIACCSVVADRSRRFGDRLCGRSLSVAADPAADSVSAGRHHRPLRAHRRRRPARQAQAVGGRREQGRRQRHRRA
jgi:hypothetical protein